MEELTYLPSKPSSFVNLLETVFMVLAKILRCQGLNCWSRWILHVAYTCGRSREDSSLEIAANRRDSNLQYSVDHWDRVRHQPSGHAYSEDMTSTFQVFVRLAVWAGAGLPVHMAVWAWKPGKSLEDQQLLRSGSGGGGHRTPTVRVRLCQRFSPS